MQTLPLLHLNADCETPRAQSGTITRNISPGLSSAPKAPNTALTDAIHRRTQRFAGLEARTGAVLGAARRRVWLGRASLVGGAAASLPILKCVTNFPRSLAFVLIAVLVAAASSTKAAFL